MQIDTLYQIRCDADIKRPIALAGKNIDIRLTFHIRYMEGSESILGPRLRGDDEIFMGLL